MREKKTKASPEVRQFLSKIGRLGGLRGGHAAAKKTNESMTRKQRNCASKKRQQQPVSKRDGSSANGSLYNPRSIPELRVTLDLLSIHN